MKQALVVLSGGQDSATCAAWAHEQFRSVRFLTFDYNQRHRKEIDAARRIAALFDSPHEVLEVPVLMGNKASALTDLTLSVSAIDPATGLPKSFVPGRNLIFLTQAASYAMSSGIFDLVTGVCQTDYSGYPDCRRSTIDALEKAIYLGNENLCRDTGFRIHTPLMFKTKAETVHMARKLPMAWEAISESWTCYEGGEKPCGVCPACELRVRGFAEACESDPAL